MYIIGNIYKPTLKIFLVTSFITILYFVLLPKFFFSSVFAVKYSLVAPTGQLTRGQTLRFTINIDTQGATIKTGQIGMTYDTQYLEYVSVTPGNAVSSVSASTPSGGKILFSGENGTGFTGQGVFAYVDLKLIAASPGSTELCVLWSPSATPTQTPTTAPTAAPTSPASTNAPTAPPAVTNLPTSGESKTGNVVTFFGLGFLIAFGIFYLVNKKIVFKKPNKS